MNPTQPIRNTPVSPTTKHRLESVRPFAQKFQYRQLPLPEPVQMPEKTATVVSNLETAKQTEEQS